jgi:hypothetical protein
MNKHLCLLCSRYLLAAWIRFLPESILLSSDDYSSGYPVRSLRLIHFMLVVTDFTSTIDIFACGVQLTALYQLKFCPIGPTVKTIISLF